MLLGFGLFSAIESQPSLDGTAASSAALQGPAGPPAPTQMGGPAGGGPAAGGPAGGGAPMMAEIRALRQRVEEDPKDREALTRLAHLYHDASMFQEAIGFYTQALQAGPPDPNLLTDVGTCLREIGRFEEALESFAAAQRVDPAHWQSLFNTVIVAGFDLQRFDRAEEALIKLEALEPAPPRLAELRARLEQFRAGAPAPGAAS